MVIWQLFSRFFGGLRRGAVLLCLGAGAGTALAQPVERTGPFGFSRPKQRRAVVPYRIERNLPVVRATINGAGPFNFLLDTGVATALLTAPGLADSLHLTHGQVFRVVGAGREATGLMAYQADGVRVALAGGRVVAPAMTWLVLSEDALNLSGYVGMPIAGILGSELFRSFVVRFEPEAGHLCLTAPAAFRAPSGRRWARLPLRLVQNKAYLNLPVCLPDSSAQILKLVLDTGAGHALSLETDAVPSRIAVPTARLPADLGRGLTGIVRGHLGRVDSLRLGRYQLRAVLTSFPTPNPLAARLDEPRDGNLGYELLKRFTLIVDYPHREILLRPNTHFREPFEHDMCGLELRASGPDFRRYVAATVAPASAAEKAGIVPDDELVSVNFINVNILSFNQIFLLLHASEGRLLFLTLRHADGEFYTTFLRLKRQI